MGAYGTPILGEGEVVGVPNERAMVVSYKLSIVTVALSVTMSAAICDRMSPTLKSTGGGSIWAQISGCSPWSRPMMFGSAESERPTRAVARGVLGGAEHPQLHLAEPVLK